MQTCDSQLFNIEIIRDDLRIWCGFDNQNNDKKNVKKINIINNFMHKFEIIIRLFDEIKQHSRKKINDRFYVFSTILRTKKNHESSTNKWRQQFRWRHDKIEALSNSAKIYQHEHDKNENFDMSKKRINAWTERE